MFCPTCGTSVAGKSEDPDRFKDIWALNVRTFDDFDAEKLQKKPVDGKALEPVYGVKD